MNNLGSRNYIYTDDEFQLIWQAPLLIDMGISESVSEMMQLQTINKANMHSISGYFFWLPVDH